MADQATEPTNPRTSQYDRWRGVADVASAAQLLSAAVVAVSVVAGIAIASKGVDDFDALFWAGIIVFAVGSALGLFMVLVARYIGARAMEWRPPED